MKENNDALRIFVDSNILVSAILSNRSISSKLLEFLVKEHELEICSYSIEEVSRVINKRFPNKISIWDRFLTSLEFELTYTPSDPTKFTAPYIRDEKDIPLLVSAIIAQPDILITGDKDFYTEEISEYFSLYSPADFLRVSG